MSTAVQWLTSETKKTHRVYDVFGPDAVLRDEVLSEIERRVNADTRISFSAAEVSADRIWQAVATAPLAGVRSRLIVVADAHRLRSWVGLEAFIEDRASSAETTLVLVSDRADAGKRVRSPDPHVRGKWLWVTEMQAWEQMIREYASGQAIQCTVPSVELPTTGKGREADRLSAVGRWLSLYVLVSQQQAAYVWSRAGQDTALARDLMRRISLLGHTDMRYFGISEFKNLVNVLLTLHGADDFAELVLFGQQESALAALRDHDFTMKDWSRILGYLSQRLDWMGPLHEALGTTERLDQVERRLNIHRKWILHYAHRETKERNIARKYDPIRIHQLRIVLGDLDNTLSDFVSVPPGFGEALLAGWQ